MSFDKNEQLFNYEIIYRPDDSEQKIYFEIKQEKIRNERCKLNDEELKAYGD